MSIASSYWQVLCWVQIDHQQRRWQSVVGKASVCTHALQNLNMKDKLDMFYSCKCREHVLVLKRWSLIVTCSTWSNFSEVESSDSHSSFRWSFPVVASSRSNHCNNVAKQVRQYFHSVDDRNKPGLKIICKAFRSCAKTEQFGGLVYCEDLDDQISAYLKSAWTLKHLKSKGNKLIIT